MFFYVDCTSLSAIFKAGAWLQITSEILQIRRKIEMFFIFGCSLGKLWSSIS